MVTDYQYASDRKNMLNSIAIIVNEGIYDMGSGYMTTKGGDCSSSIDARDISAYRIQKCGKLDSLDMTLVASGSEINGEDSYFTFLKGHSDRPEACRLKIDNIDDFNISLFLECKGMPNNFQIENEFITFANTSLKKFYKSSNDSATALMGEDTLGDKNDGMVKITIEK
jgi:hypothetical protein